MPGLFSLIGAEPSSDWLSAAPRLTNTALCSLTCHLMTSMTTVGSLLVVARFRSGQSGPALFAVGDLQVGLDEARRRRGWRRLRRRTLCPPLPHSITEPPRTVRTLANYSARDPMG
jgi:hypothetical protein